MKTFPKKEFLRCLPVNRCSCQLIAWVFQYAPGSAAGATYRRVRHSHGLRLGLGEAQTQTQDEVFHSLRVRHSHGLWLGLGEAQTQTQDEVFHSLHYPMACGWVC